MIPPSSATNATVLLTKPKENEDETGPYVRTSGGAADGGPDEYDDLVVEVGTLSRGISGSSTVMARRSYGDVMVEVPSNLPR